MHDFLRFDLEILLMMVVDTRIPAKTKGLPNHLVLFVLFFEFRRLPVIDDKGQMVGIITAKDIFKAVMKTFKETRKDQDLMSEGFDLLGLLGVE